MENHSPAPARGRISRASRRISRASRRIGNTCLGIKNVKISTDPIVASLLLVLIGILAVKYPQTTIIQQEVAPVSANNTMSQATLAVPESSGKVPNESSFVDYILDSGNKTGSTVSIDRGTLEFILGLARKGVSAMENDNLYDHTKLGQIETEFKMVNITTTTTTAPAVAKAKPG